MNSGWQEVVRQPEAGDHLVQLYQDEAFLADAVAAYIDAGLRKDEAAILIVTPGHKALFLDRFEEAGLDPRPAIERGQLRFLDAEATLQKFMRDGMPQWREFQETVGGTLAELRCQHPGIRAYGEMVDVLWRAGKHDAAIRLEEYWNDLCELQTFSLLCAYYMDNLDASAYGGPLECVCKVHSHLIPARDYAAFNAAVAAASREVLEQPLARALESLSASQRDATTTMPAGQATLIWLKKNMPRTADKVLERVRTRLA
jgi:hypothetical protein